MICTLLIVEKIREIHSYLNGEMQVVIDEFKICPED